jgi:ornithine carbamoyltransferase
VNVSERDFLSIADLSADELERLLDDADKVKSKPSKWSDRIAGRQVALIFEKPSTRTRVSFEVAVTSMGGHAIVLRSDELQLGRGETIEDTGAVLSRYVDALVVRTFEQERLERLAKAATIPVINALSDYSHPCQALADLQTIREAKGRLQELALGYIGDGNNVAHSLLFAGSAMGMHVRVATPPGYEPSPRVVERSAEIAAGAGGSVSAGNVVAEAASDADVLYTDVWASMGQESEASDRAGVFEQFRVDRDVLALAKDDAIVMHCLPAHRGEEISAEVIDGPRSVVWDQAENRLHTQKALLAWLLDPDT